MSAADEAMEPPHFPSNVLIDLNAPLGGEALNKGLPGYGRVAVTR
jgi:hypothetical protein